MGHLVLQKAGADRRRRQHLRLTKDLDMAVVVSTQQLMSATFVDTVLIRPGTDGSQISPPVTG